MAIKKNTTKTAKKATRTKKNKIVSYRISRAVISLTYLGTLWRTAIISALLVTTTVWSLAQNHYMFINSDISREFNFISPLSDTFLFTEALKLVIATSAAFAVIDGLYVFLTRKYPLNAAVDKPLLFGIELVFFFLVLLSFAISSVAYVSIVTNSYLLDLFKIIELSTLIILLCAALLVPVRYFVGVTLDVAMKRRK